MKVKEFVLSNKNPDTKWCIDGENFLKVDMIPKYIMNRYLYEWTINKWDMTVFLMTYVSK